MPVPMDVPLGWPLPRRKQFLDELLGKAQASKYKHQLRFQGQARVFDVYAVDIAMPKYRLSSGRTQAAQEEYLAKNPDRPEEFFTRDMESVEAQRVQHTILRGMVESTELMAYFKDPANTQDQPLILTDKGYVLNGNRRLCAFRDLFFSDQERYARYSHADVVVLPFCDDKDHDELEAYLQIQPDIKEEYTWIAKACMLRARQQRYGYTTDDLARLYGLKDKEVQATLAQLALVDEFLVSRKRDRQYDLVIQADYAFKELVKGRQRLRQPEQRDLFTQIAFCLVDDPDAAGGRLYQRIPSVRDHLGEISGRLMRELPAISEFHKQSVDVSPLGVEVESTGIEQLTRVVEKPEHRETVVESVIDVVDSHKELRRQRERAGAVLKEISEAHAHCKNAVNYIDGDSSKAGVQEQMQAMERIMAQIRVWLTSDA